MRMEVYTCRGALGKVIIALVASSCWRRRQRTIRPPALQGTGGAGPFVTRVERLSATHPPLKGTANDSLAVCLRARRMAEPCWCSAAPTPARLPASRLPSSGGERCAHQGRHLRDTAHKQERIHWNSAPRADTLLYYHIPTEFRARKFRMGDRVTNPLDQWPDPDVYIHYPTGRPLLRGDKEHQPLLAQGQMGPLTEQTCMPRCSSSGSITLISSSTCTRRSCVPVTNCIVAPSKSATIAVMTQINLAATSISTRSRLRWLPRSVSQGDRRPPDAYPFLLEAPEPFLDQPPGPKTEALLLEGVVEFLLAAGKRGLLFVDYDENGKSIELRVGRHLTTTLGILDEWNFNFPEAEIIFECPGYYEMLENGVGVPAEPGCCRSVKGRMTTSHQQRRNVQVLRRGITVATMVAVFRTLAAYGCTSILVTPGVGGRPATVTKLQTRFMCLEIERCLRWTGHLAAWWRCPTCPR